MILKLKPGWFNYWASGFVFTPGILDIGQEEYLWGAFLIFLAITNFIIACVELKSPKGKRR